MLQLTRLGGPAFALNPDLIERAEVTPDTVVTLVNGSKYMIAESLEELIELIRVYRVELISAAQAAGAFMPMGALSPQAHGRPTAHRREPNSSGTVVSLHVGEH